MSRRQGKLDKLLKLASAEERQTGEQTGRSRAQLNDHLRKLAELNAYRQAYAAKAQGSSSFNSSHWKDYRNFLYRLDDAVRAQQHIVHDCERTLEAHRKRWMAKRQKLESLQRVQERHAQTALTKAARIEQNQLDELALRNDIFNDD